MQLTAVLCKKNKLLKLDFKYLPNFINSISAQALDLTLITIKPTFEQ